MHDDVIYLDIGGLKRRYVLHKPLGARPGIPAVIMLDGRGGTPWTAMKSSGWSQKADAEGFLAVYPEALRIDPSGPQHFLTNPQMWTDADAPFLVAVMDDVIGNHGADTRLIYMSGFSNGAAMTFKMAVEASGRLAAIAPVAGPCLVRPQMGGRRSVGAVPTIYFYGKRDPLNPFDGGEVELPWGVKEFRPSVHSSIRAWAQIIGAPPPVVEEADGVTTERYGEHFEFHAIHDLGHVWPGGHRLLPEKIVGASSNRVKTTDMIWEFFSRNSG